MAETPASSPPPPEAANAFPERSDRWLEFGLGRDLQGATLRGALYLLGVGVVLATIAAFVR
jgi:hypothetical protein